MEYGHYEITIKETGREKPVSTEYHGFINHEGLVSFFGLKEPDVEWYDIREITGQQEENPKEAAEMKPGSGVFLLALKRGGKDRNTTAASACTGWAHRGWSSSWGGRTMSGSTSRTTRYRTYMTPSTPASYRKPYTGCNIWNSGGRASGYVRSNNTGPLEKHLNKISRQGRIFSLPFCRPSSDRQGD